MKKKLIIGISLLIGIVIIMIIIFGGKKEYSILESEEIKDVKKSDVEVLYEIITNVDCNKIIEFEINDELSAKDISDNDKAKLVYSYIDSDNLLNEKLTKDIYYEYSKKLFGYEIEVINLDYKGKKYDIGNNSTNIEKGGECSSSVTTTLHGYTYNKNELSIDIEIDEDNVYRYGFIKYNNNYILDNITKVVMIKG